MADKRISELTNITGANLADADEFVVVDTSASETKAITWAELKEGLDTGTGFVRITGDTMTGNLSFGDNDKAIFGAGSDLQIYHDGSDSYVRDAGAGNLYLQGDASVRVRSSDGTLTSALFTPSGLARLSYAGVAKLETTSTGIDVTGTVTADGLTVESGTSGITVDTSVSLSPEIKPSQALSDLIVSGTGNGGHLKFKTDDTDRVKIDGGTGDISFYEDTGTTPKFFWDASAESLGIGTSSPTLGLLQITGSVGSSYFITAGNGLGFSRNSANYIGATGGSSSFLSFATGGTSLTDSAVQRMVITSTGNVGIGTSSPSSILHLSSAQSTVRTIAESTNAAGYVGYRATNGTGYWEMQVDGSNQGLRWLDDGSEVMRIDASGNLLVGQSTSAIPGAGNTTTGISVSGQYDAIYASRSSGQPLVLNRNTSDGIITDFRKDGATVGSIGYGGGGVLYNAASNYGLKFYDAWANIIHPATTAGGDIDGSVDLGYSDSRFKDLYLSGGVYLGGTGAANKLDDYEEGTWTPDVIGTTTAGTGTYAGRTGKYTKVGNLVTVFGSYELTAHTGSGNLRIDGLPFTAANESNLYTIGQWSSNNLTLDAIAVQVYVFSNPNTDYLLVSQVRNAASNLPVVLDVAHSAWFSISYYV